MSDNKSINPILLGADSLFCNGTSICRFVDGVCTYVFGYGCV